MADADTAREGGKEDQVGEVKGAEDVGGERQREFGKEKGEASQSQGKGGKKAGKKGRGGGRGKAKGKAVVSESESESSESEGSGEEESESGGEVRRRRARKKRALKAELAKAKAKAERAKARSKAKKKARREEESSEEEEDSDESSEETESESESDSESESEEEARRARRRKAKRKQRELEEEVDEEEEAVEEDEGDEEESSLDFYHRQLRLLAARAGLQTLKSPGRAEKALLEEQARTSIKKKSSKSKKKDKKGKKKSKKTGALEFKRVDELWDRSIHNFKLKESAEDPEDEFEDSVFTVRRCFDYENKYKQTLVDIKSKLLCEALQEIMKDVKGVSMDEETPVINPNMLFLHLEELRAHVKKTLRAREKKEKKRKERKRLKLMRAHCKLMVDYLDEDYKKIKKTLEPMLEAGNITFELVWAIFKPNTICYTKTYGSAEHPRCFKVDTTYKDKSIMSGEYYSVDGRYLEYDGKIFGLGDFDVDIREFKGVKKISSLECYPLEYHKDAEKLRKELIERGKVFTSLTGMNYRFHKGLAFEKRRKGVAKHNVNGRVMIDPAIFRRINANYQFSNVRAKEYDDLISLPSDSDDESDEEPRPHQEREEKEKFKVKYFWDEEAKQHRSMLVAVDELGNEFVDEKLEKLSSSNNPDTDGSTADDDDDDDKPPEFTDEDLLIASPVVYGFAFSEKRWLEFSLSGIRPIAWNAGAFDSLVLADDNKSIVKALVSSHKFHPASTIDDVVQGKGRGLVFLLHGPPGVGKTLTAEGIADFLHCPLYAVSAGELGTDSWRLEEALQRIMDVAHSWGAILLLDEADVFLEKRQIHDIHRNALVSIFLRLLEYFQGILILTTNRVETFDDAFQSRMHLALRYDELTPAAKKKIWKIFIERVRAESTATATATATATIPASVSTSAAAPTAAAEGAGTGTGPSTMSTKNAVGGGVEMSEFRDRDLESLAREGLNGRQIKNAVQTAHALALDEGEKLGIRHVRRVLRVAQSFERDLKGGSGYEDAMRSYT